MQAAKREYDAKLDSKRRITIRNAVRELTVPYQISSNTLSMMDKAVENLKIGRVSEPVVFADNLTRIAINYELSST